MIVNERMINLGKKKSEISAKQLKHNVSEQYCAKVELTNKIAYLPKNIFAKYITEYRHKECR